MLQYHVGISPFPSWADVLYLAAYVPLVAALVVLMRQRQRVWDRPAWIDSAVILLAAVSVAATFGLLPMATQTSSDLSTVLALVYPILDLVVLAVLIRLMVGGGRPMTSLMLLTGSVVATLTPDLVYNGIGAAPAFADDLPHFFTGNPATLAWMGGCSTTYSLTPEAAGYAPYAKAAFTRITEQTNISFTRLPDGDPNARVRINVATTDDGTAGWGSTDGAVTLAPTERVTFGDDRLDATVRMGLVAHESLHTFGLDHDPTLTEHEVMGPVLDLQSDFTWGPSDLAGLAVLRTRNHCIAPGVQDPAFTAPAQQTADPPATTEPRRTIVVITTTTKAKCKKVHGKWTATTHRCAYLKRH